MSRYWIRRRAVRGGAAICFCFIITSCIASPETHTVAVTVSDSSGEMLSGCTLSIDSQEGSYQNPDIGLVTDSQGSIAVELPSGKYTVSALCGDQGQGMTNIEVPATLTADITVAAE